MHRPRVQWRTGSRTVGGSEGGKRLRAPKCKSVAKKLHFYLSCKKIRSLSTLQYSHIFHLVGSSLAFDRHTPHYNHQYKHPGPLLCNQIWFNLYEWTSFLCRTNLTYLKSLNTCCWHIKKLIKTAPNFLSPFPPFISTQIFRCSRQRSEPPPEGSIFSFISELPRAHVAAINVSDSAKKKQIPLGTHCTCKWQFAK